MCAFVTLLHSSYHEMLDIDPNALKFCMIVPSMLMDVWGLIVHFYHLPFPFYACICMVWQFVSHNLMINLCNFISISNDLCWSWFFVWWSCWVCCMLMNVSRMIWIISVLIWIFHSQCPFECFEIVFDFPCTWNAFSWWFWCGPF